ncbi:MAG: hypothetical protein JSU87_11635 [Gemmatimonadota bacterium]|nr:MAG: hypothetical protein JSU87_11635 [Gemmatimonadota bacterium]
MRSLIKLTVTILVVIVAGCGDQDRSSMLGPVELRPHLRSDGISGHSGAPGSQLCSRCHDPDAGAAAPTVTLSGPTNVTAGATSTYTLTIQPASGSNQAQGGLNVSVPGGGVLIAGNGTRIDAGEIVHSQPRTGSGTLTWSFQWEAPSTAGSFEMYGVGLSTDGSSTRGDEQGTDKLAISVQTSGNQPPTADPKTASTDAGVPVEITLGGSDLETCELSFSIISGPTKGSLSPLADRACSGSGGFSDQARVTYSPAADAYGGDQFTYRTTDEGGLTADAVVEITIFDPSQPTDYDIQRLRAKKDKSDMLVAIFSIKNGRGTAEPITAQLYVDDPSASGDPTCTMTVSDEPGGKAASYIFSSATGCIYPLTTKPTPATYHVTVRLLDDAPDSLTDAVQVRRLSSSSSGIMNFIDIFSGLF